MVNTSSNEIVIDISKSINPTFFEEGSIIHQSDFETVIFWIQERLGELEKVQHSRSKGNQIRYNDTISILGSRGSGKTSFLMSLIHEYRNSEDLEVIEIIDPTLIEEKGHIFLTILSLIQEKVMDKLGNGCYDLENINYHEKEDWDSKLKSLAEGIPSIDGIGQDYQSVDWMSAEHIMDKGLRSVMAAKKLESNINILVDCSLRILDKKAFLFIFDDIDIDFRRGWPVLETIRKYMTSKRIITLLSGDLRLYSKAIRKQQWKNFGKALLINEAERLNRVEDYDALVTEMEGQYLQKVIRPERRIYLKTLQEKKDRYNQLVIKVKQNKDKDSKLITELYHEILKQHGICNKQEADPYQTFLLNLPLRSQIQLLAEFYTSKDGNNQLDIDLAKVFLSDIYNKGIDIELASSNHKMIISTILSLLIQEQNILYSYQLQPTTQDHSLNATFVALSFLLSSRIALYPELIFEYLIKIGYVRNIMDFFTYDSQATKESISIDLLLNHASLLQENVLKGTVSKTASVLQSHDKGARLYQGFIPLYAIKKGEIIKTDSEAKNILSMLPSTALNLSNKNNYYASIYLILGALGDLIKYAEIEDEFVAHFMELAQLKTYKVPYVSSQTSEEEIAEQGEEGKQNNESQDEKNKDLENLILAIRTWAIKLKGIRLSPHFLGKVSTRMYSSLHNLESFFKRPEVHLAEALELSIFSFFNAVLVEEVRENIKGGVNLNLNNLATGDSVFVQNLNKVSELPLEQIELLELTIRVFQCPLFWLYLKPLEVSEDSKEGGKNIMNFLKKPREKSSDNSSNEFSNNRPKVILDLDQDVLKIIKNYNIYKELKEVRINKNEEPKEVKKPFLYGKYNYNETIGVFKKAEIWNVVEDNITKYFESKEDKRNKILNETLQLIKDQNVFTGVGEKTLSDFFNRVHEDRNKNILL